MGADSCHLDLTGEPPHFIMTPILVTSFLWMMNNRGPQHLARDQVEIANISFRPYYAAPYCFSALNINKVIKKD